MSETKCKNCQYYKPINDSMGDCFGHEVPAEMDADKCPTHSFTLRQSTSL